MGPSPGLRERERASVRQGKRLSQKRGTRPAGGRGGRAPDPARGPAVDGWRHAERRPGRHPLASRAHRRRAARRADAEHAPPSSAPPGGARSAAGLYPLALGQRRVQLRAGRAQPRAMRAFYERQQSRQPAAQTNNPFAPAGMRRGPSGPAQDGRSDDPAAAGGALAQRLANKRRREEAEARRARGEPDRTVSPSARAEPTEDEGALARVLARRRQSLLQQSEPEEAASPAPGRRHAAERAEASPGMRVVPLQPVVDDDDEPAPARRAPAKNAAKTAAKPARATKTAKAA